MFHLLPPLLSFLLLSTLPTLAHTYTVNLGSKVAVAELAANVEKLTADNKQLAGEVEKLTARNKQLAGEVENLTVAMQKMELLANPDVQRLQKDMQSVTRPARKTLLCCSPAPASATHVFVTPMGGQSPPSCVTLLLSVLMFARLLPLPRSVFNS